MSALFEELGNADLMAFHALNWARQTTADNERELYLKYYRYWASERNRLLKEFNAILEGEC